MFRNKIEVIPFKEFMDRDWKEKKDQRKKQSLDIMITKMASVAVVGHLAIDTKQAHASMTSDIIMRAFQPIVDLLQGISYPIAFIMITAGFLLIMTGQTSRGTGFIKWACLGYIGLQFAPALLQIVVTIGQNIQAEISAQ